MGGFWGAGGVAEHALAGSCAGVVGTVLGFPLDTIKTRLQSQAGGAHQLGVGTLARTILKEEGFRGFYRGIAPPLTALTILNTLSFACYSSAKKYLRVGQVGPVKCADGSTKFVFEPRVMLAGIAGGPLGSLLSTPFEVLKVQMQMDNVTGQRYRNSLHAAQCIVTEHGIRALYLGHLVNTNREMIFLATYFGTYEHSRAVFEQNLPRAIAVPVAGGISGALAWFISFPLDCIKAQIQGQRLDAARSKDLSQPRVTAIRAAAQIYNAKGLLGLYTGVAPSIARAFLVSGSRFSAYEFAVWALNGT